MKILAKSNGLTLLEHTRDVLMACEEICKKISSVPQKFEDLLKLAAFYHDLGKVIPSFQKKVGGQKPTNDIPHSFVSVVFIPKELLLKLGDDAKILLSAVVYHHWRDSYLDFLLGARKELVKEAFKKLLEDEPLRKQLLSRLQEEMKGLSEHEDVFKVAFNESLCKYLSHNSLVESGLLLPPHIFSLLPSLVLSEFNVKDEDYKKYVLVVGTLMRADRFASACEQDQVGKPIDQMISQIEISMNVDPYDVVHKKLQDTIGSEPWQAQKLKQGLQGENLILVAPTGSGKTEFAFMWTKGKTIFTLPLRSATNMIFERAKGYFGTENVSLLHSDADLHIYSSGDFDEEGEVWKILELSRSLSYPFIVSTGDQIFPACLKYPGYEIVYSVLSRSYLIVDEIQAYSPESAAIIVKMLEDVNALGGRFLLMTATLPNFIKEIVRKRTKLDERQILDVYNEIEQGQRKRNVVCFVCSDDPCEKAKEFFLKGKKVLVVRNTIENAKKTFEQLRKEIEAEKVYLIHSQLTSDDRSRIEQKLEDYRPGKQSEPIVLVSTQVVEASLDIDFDVLLTDVAPADSLVQRMGRVYRRRSYDCKEPNVYVYVGSNREEYESLFKDVYEKDLVNRTIQSIVSIVTGKDVTEMLESLCRLEPFLIEESEKKSWVEKTYDNLDANKGYKKKFYDTLSVLDSGYCSERKIDAMRIFRRISSVDVVAKNLLEPLLQELQKEKMSYLSFKAIMSKYVVTVPTYRVKMEELVPLAEELSRHVNMEANTRKWLQGIYVLKGSRYIQNQGIIFRGEQA